MQIKTEKVLIYMIGSLGDTLVTLPALKVVREHFGASAEVCILYNKPKHGHVSPVSILKPLGLITESIEYKVGNLSELLCLWEMIREKKFSIVFYLMPSARTPMRVFRDKAFFSFCKINRKVGFSFNSKKKLYPRDPLGLALPVEHESVSRIKRLESKGFKVDIFKLIQPPILALPQECIERARSYLLAKRQYPERLLVAVCPGSKQPANFWPDNNFEKLWQLMSEQSKFELMVIGGEQEKTLGERMIRKSGVGLNAAGVHDVMESASLLFFCRFAIGLNSGPTHLAAAVGTKVIGIYGQRDFPGQWEPMGSGHIILKANVCCAGCGYVVCPRQGHPCMSEIEVGDVMDAVEIMTRRVAANS